MSAFMARAEQKADHHTEDMPDVVPAQPSARENVARLRCKACGSDVVVEPLGSFVSGFRCPQCDGEGK